MGFQAGVKWQIPPVKTWPTIVFRLAPLQVRLDSFQVGWRLCGDWMLAEIRDEESEIADHAAEKGAGDDIAEKMQDRRQRKEVSNCSVVCALFSVLRSTFPWRIAKLSQTSERP